MEQHKNMQATKELSGTLKKYSVWKQQKTIQRGRVIDVPQKTSTGCSSQYVFRSSGTEPNLYVPKSMPYLRTFFVPVSTGDSGFITVMNFL